MIHRHAIAVLSALPVLAGAPAIEAAGIVRGLDEVAAPTDTRVGDVRGTSGIGRQWIRSHPFTLTALSQQAALTNGATYRGAGLNTFLAWKRPAELLPIAVGGDLPWHFHLSETTLTQTVIDEITLAAGHPGNTGWIVNDEPTFLEMADTAVIVDHVRQRFPEALVYTNAFPIGADAQTYYGDGSNPNYDYSNYLDDIATIVRPDVMMYDFYPFGIGGVHSGFYYTNLMAVRARARSHELPYWAWIQAWEKPAPPFDKRLPSESDLRFQMFTHLAAGYQGFSYFAWDLGDLTSLVDASGNTSPLYDVAGPANREVENLGQALRFLENTDVRYVANTGNPTPALMTDWAPGAGGDPFILRVDIDRSFPGSTGPWKDGVIGFFSDDEDERYFMLTNAYHGENMTAADTLLHFEIEFDAAITQVLRLNRLTGMDEIVQLDPSNTLRLALPGGTGMLFKYDTGRGFPGVVIPEPSTLCVLCGIALTVIAAASRRRGTTWWVVLPRRRDT